MRRLHLVSVLLVFMAGCVPPDEGEEPIGGERTYLFRSIGGVSMGAMGASMIGTRHPERFDAVGGLGGAMDYGYLLHYMRTQHLGGFCTYEDLLAILDAHPDDPDILDDRETMDACAVLHPTSLDWEHQQSFNHWHFDDDGGTFDRNSYLDMFEDLSLALGSPTYHNPDSPFFPPWMTDDWTCDDPIVIRGYDSGGTAPLYNAEYNPEGRFDVISFCDGDQPVIVCDATGEVVDFCAEDDAETFCGEDGPPVRARRNVHPDAYYAQMGRYDPCRPATRRVRVAYAVDLNGNGRRDYGEPIIVNAHDRFEDVGTGGEPYHWLDNPLGTAGNWVHDEGEPFLDHGLDGVPGTGDYGEGTGSFTLAPNLAKYFDHDPRTNIGRWSDEDVASTDLWLDGGIRDIFNFGVTSAQVWGRIATRSDDATWYDRFTSLPSVTGDWPRGFDFIEVDWPSVGRHVFLRYGDPDATEHRRRQGDGAHVGTGTQAINRFNTYFAWLGERWPNPDYEPVSYGTIDELAFESTYFSPALGSDRTFAIALPPGYFEEEHAEKAYPVAYFLHGYGMAPVDLLAANIIFQSHMATGILPKFIMVYGDGRCCFVNEDTGARDCYEPQGRRFEAPWRRECNKGSFYVNRSGFTHGDDTPYEESIFDLMRHVESNYRVAVPEEARLD